MADEEAGAVAAPKSKIDIQTVLVLLNSLLVLGALGTMVYTKLIYERPAIVEETEIKKVEEEVKKPSPAGERVIVPFDQMLVNLALTAGTAHYATVTLALECRDEEAAAIVKAKKAIILDRVIAAFGRRQMSDVNTIQGKLLLKTELLRSFNDLIPPGGITDVFFSNFVVE